MIHTLSAYVQARQRGMIAGQSPGNFGKNGPQQAQKSGPPKSAQEVSGPTDAVRKADKTADRNRNRPKP